MRPERPAGVERRRPLRRHRAALARMSAVAVVAALWSCGALTTLDHAAGDMRFAAWSRRPSGQLLIVDIDSASLTIDRSWPWSRNLYADIVDRLRAADAAAIALDVDLSTPGAADGDAAFERALERADGSVILASLLDPMASDDDARPLRIPIRRFADLSWPALVNQGNRNHGIVRDIARFEPVSDPRLLPQTSLPGLSTALVAPPPSPDRTFTIDYGIDAARIDRVSADALLGGRVDRERIAGRKVLIGATAPELGDFVSVPRFGFVPGVTLHALAAESLVQGRALRPVAPWLTLLACGLLLAAASTLGARFRLAGHLATLLAAAPLGEGLALALQHTVPLLPATAPLHAGLLCFALIAVAVEIDDRRVGLLRSRSEAERLRTILGRVVADNFAGIVVVDHDGAVRAISAAAASIIGLPPGLDGQMHYGAVLPGPLAAACAEALEGAADGAPGGVRPAPMREIRCTVRGGVGVILNCVVTPSRVPGPVGPDGRLGPERSAICLSFADVTEARAAEARLVTMAKVDALTGLSNRRVLVEGVEAALARPSQGGVTALLFFDLDRFRIVNDRLGHAGGDQLLVAVAQRLEGFADGGDLPARLGGDEFAVLVARPSEAEVRRFADELVAAVGGVHVLGPYEASIGISVGVALATGGGEAATLMREADAAMTVARAAGGDRAVVFDAAMERGAEDDRALEQDLRDGLRRGEFLVFYQRQVDLATDLITGVEALVRWPHPVRGFVSPAKFIPIAERTGLIEALGAWVLRQACHDAAGWPEPITVSVNLSAIQLSRGDLVATVFDALTASGLPAERLDLELTESLLMENDGAARDRLDRLRAAGIGLSLDDFGTGFSSLSYLRTFAIDKLKIDQSFVRGLPADRPAAAIIAAVVSLAGNLGLRVNAEGCETAEQLAQLKALGCDEVQGWFHGRPEPSALIVQSLLEQRERVMPAVAEA